MELQFKIVIGCDLAAYDFKLELIERMRKKGYNITDIGCHSCKEGDYPVSAKLVGEGVASGEFDRGIAICGTGQGICMAANKVKGVRAALCHDIFPAILSREHNNANVLALGAWMIDIDKAERIAEAFLFGKYSGKVPQHEIRIKQMLEMEENR